MSRTDPGRGCFEIAFARAYPLGEGAELALEDYARALAGSQAAEAITGPGPAAAVSGVHLCGAAAEAPAELASELEEFTRDLAARSGGAGLGWE